MTLEATLAFLIAHRQRHGWTQAQVARKMNRTQGFVSRLEHGHVDLTPELMDSYAHAMGFEYQR